MSKLICCGLSTHTQAHTQTMAHHHHHSPLSRNCASSRVLCAIILPIAVVAAVAHSSPSLPLPLPVLLPLVTIALFVAVAIPIAFATLIIALIAAQPPVCSLSPNCATHLQQWQRQRQWQQGGGNSAAVAIVRQWQYRGSGDSKAVVIARQHW